MQKNFEQEKVDVIQEHFSRQETMQKEFADKMEALEKKCADERKTLDSERVYALNNAEGEYIAALKQKEAEMSDSREAYEKKIYDLEEEVCDCRRQIKADGQQVKMNAMRVHYENVIAELRQEIADLQSSGDFQVAKDVQRPKRKRVSFEIPPGETDGFVQRDEQPRAQQMKRKLFTASVFPMQF